MRLEICWFLSMKLAGSMQDDEFPWGKADGAHSWHEGDDGMSIKFNPLLWGSLKIRLRKHEQNSLCVCVICYIKLTTSTSWENLMHLKGIHICTQSWMAGSFFELAMVQQISSCCWVYMEIWTECKRDIVWQGWRIASTIVVPISVSINESCAKTCKNLSSAYP